MQCSIQESLFDHLTILETEKVELKILLEWFAGHYPITISHVQEQDTKKNKKPIFYWTTFFSKYKKIVEGFKFFLSDTLSKLNLDLSFLVYWAKEKFLQTLRDVPDKLAQQLKCRKERFKNWLCSVFISRTAFCTEPIPQRMGGNLRGTCENYFQVFT